MRLTSPPLATSPFPPRIPPAGPGRPYWTTPPTLLSPIWLAPHSIHPGRQVDGDGCVPCAVRLLVVCGVVGRRGTTCGERELALSDPAARAPLWWVLVQIVASRGGADVSSAREAVVKGWGRGTIAVRLRGPSSIPSAPPVGVATAGSLQPSNHSRLQCNPYSAGPAHGARARPVDRRAGLGRCVPATVAPAAPGCSPWVHGGGAAPPSLRGVFGSRPSRTVTVADTRRSTTTRGPWSRPGLPPPLPPRTPLKDGPRRHSPRRRERPPRRRRQPAAAPPPRCHSASAAGVAAGSASRA